MVLVRFYSVRKVPTARCHLDYFPVVTLCRPRNCPLTSCIDRTANDLHPTLSLWLFYLRRVSDHRVRGQGNATSFSRPDLERSGRIGALFAIAIINIFLYPCLAVLWERSRYRAKNPERGRSWFPWRRTPNDDQVAVSEGNAIELRNLNKTFEGPGFWPFKRAKKLTVGEDPSYSGEAQEAWGLRVWYIP